MSKTANHNTIVGIRTRLKRKGMDEIRDGAISTLYQKLKNKIIDPSEITHTKNKKIIGSVLCWINDRIAATNNKIDNNLCERITDSIRILTILAKTDTKSQKLVRDFGAEEFFLNYKNDAQADLHGVIDDLLKTLVNEHSGTQNSESKYSSYPISTYSWMDNMSETGTVTDDEYKCISTFKESKFVDTINDRDMNTRFGMDYENTNPNVYYASNYDNMYPNAYSHMQMEKQVSFGARQEFEVQIDMTQSRQSTPKIEILSTVEEEKVQMSNLKSNRDLNSSKASKTTKENKPIPKNLNRTYIQLEKEKCELPLVKITKNDYNLLTDTWVRMRYGDVKSHTESSRNLESHLFKDFPFEVFLQKTEIIYAVLDVIVSTIEKRIFNNWVLVLLKFLESAVPMYKFLLNPYNRFPEAQSHSSSGSAELLNDIMKWQQREFSKETLASTAIDSNSLPFILWEIASKVLDCALDEEKFSGAFVVYRAAIKAFTQIYNIQGADEFTDIFIKILNSFDYILTSLSMSSTQISTKTVIVQCIPALEITNSIFNCSKYSEDDDSYHPKTKILISSTLKLQQDLRKYLFDQTFNKSEAKVVLEFFTYKSKLDKRDEYIVSSYQRAVNASQVYQMAWKFRLNVIDATSNGDSEIKSNSEFENLLNIMQQLVVWIELCMDFPFETWMLNLVEFSELVEQSNLDSNIDEVVTLFIEYLKLPLLEVRYRIIKKCIMRLQLREELLSQKENEIKSKFLTTFLTRTPILKIMWNDLLLSSLITDHDMFYETDGKPKNSELKSITPEQISELIVKYVSVLVSCCNLTERRLLSQVIHSFQISSIKFERDSKYIIESIDDCCKYRTTKTTRILRDLFSTDSKKRQIATHILKKSWDRYDLEDLLKESFDIDTCADDALIELNVYSKGVKDHSYFDFDSLYSIFSSNSDVTLKKSAIEQLSILINDRSDNLGVSGRRLFREKKVGKDVFSIAVREIISICQLAGDRGINILHPNETVYAQMLLRFLSLALLFYFDEAVVIELMKSYTEINDTEESEESQVYILIECLKEFLGSKKLDVWKNSLRCLQIILLRDQVKTCIDSSTSMPYFSVPTYMSEYCIYLFPVKTYKYSVISKISPLTHEEKQLIKLETETQKDESKFSFKFDEKLSKCSYNESLFEKISSMTLSDTFDFINSKMFITLLANTTSMSMTKFMTEKGKLGSDNFEIMQSDLTSVSFLQSLKILLKDLKAKLKDIPDGTKLGNGLKSFYLLIIAKMKEINLPYHFLYTQIIDMGIENKITSATDNVKLTEAGSNLVEALRNITEIIIWLIETDKVINQKFNISFNWMQELIRFEHVKEKSLIDDLIKLSLYLKDKGEPFKVLVLKLTTLYFEHSDFSKLNNNILLDKIGSFAIDIVASVKLSEEFYTNYSIIMSLKILNAMVEYHDYSISDKVGSKSDLPQLSEAGLERISSYNSYGWLTRFITHRDIRIKVMVWNILTNLVSSNLINQHPSLIDSAFECFLNDTEIYSIKMASLNFLTQIWEYLMRNESYLDNDSDNDEDTQQEPEEISIKMKYIIKCVEKYMMLTKIEHMLYQDSIPCLFVSTLIRFLKWLKSDFSNCLPLFTTLDIWNTLSLLLKPAFVMQKYKCDNRSILFKGKNKRLIGSTISDETLFDAYLVDAISIISFVLESVKKDKNIAGMIVRSVPFLENMMKCLVYNVQNKNEQTDTLIFTGLTLIQYLLAYSEEDTFKQLCTLFAETSELVQVDQENEGKFDYSDDVYDHMWPLFSDMIGISDKIEVHYSVIRFASSMILCFNKYADGNNGLSKPSNSDENLSYGVQMWYKFCVLFKRVYFTKKSEKQEFSESFKDDICSCLSILLLNSKEAKLTAIKENLVQKLSERAADFCSAYRVSILQNTKNKSYDRDTRFFERECLRMLKILKNVFNLAGESLANEIIDKPVDDTGFTYSVVECPKTIHKLVEIYENSAQDTDSYIFIEIGEVLCTLASQSNEIKKCFSMNVKHKKNTAIKSIIKSVRDLNPLSKGPEVKTVLNLITSLCLTSENVKMIIKDKLIEEIVQKLLPSIKTEKDILSRKVFLTWFSKLIAAFTYTKEGAAAAVNYKDVFNLALFCLDELTAPNSNENDMILNFLVNLLLFLGNSSSVKKNKQHVINNKSIFTMLSCSDYPLKIKAFAAQAICSTLHDDQGVKAKWNPKIISMIEEIKVAIQNDEFSYDEDESVNASLQDRHLVTNLLIPNLIENMTLQNCYKSVCIQALEKISM